MTRADGTRMLYVRRKLIPLTWVERAMGALGRGESGLGREAPGALEAEKFICALKILPPARARRVESGIAATGPPPTTRARVDAMATTDDD